MNTLKKILVALLLISGICGVSSIYAEDYTVIGNVSGVIEAGELYELYKNSPTSLLNYLAGWKFVGDKDKTKDLSWDQIYEACLSQAKSEYGRYYNNLDVTALTYEVKFDHLEDETYYAQDFSGTEYKKKNRTLKKYIYSANVIIRYK